MTAASDQALPTFPVVQLLYHSASCLASAQLDSATSSAAALVSPSTACLLATQTDAPGAPARPWVERSTKDEQVDRGFQLDGRYNLSELAAVFKIAVRIDNLVECKNSVDDWL
jgi:hypothetical protein